MLLIHFPTMIFFAAFISLVIFKYFRQHEVQKIEDGEAEAEAGEKEEQQALVVAEPVEEPGDIEQHQTLVVAEQGCQNKSPGSP